MTELEKLLIEVVMQARINSDTSLKKLQDLIFRADMKQISADELFRAEENFK